MSLAVVPTACTNPLPVLAVMGRAPSAGELLAGWSPPRGVRLGWNRLGVSPALGPGGEPDGTRSPTTERNRGGCSAGTWRRPP